MNMGGRLSVKLSFNVCTKIIFTGFLTQVTWWMPLVEQEGTVYDSEAHK